MQSRVLHLVFQPARVEEKRVEHDNSRFRGVEGRDIAVGCVSDVPEGEMVPI